MPGHRHYEGTAVNPMDACYYCGAPLKQGAVSCRFCGTAVDPLDVPLCDSENSSGFIFDEAPVLPLSDVKYPMLLSFDSIIQPEAGMETKMVAFPETQADDAVPEAASAEPEAAYDEPEAVSDEPEAVSDEPELLPEERLIIPEAMTSAENNDEQPVPVQAEQAEEDPADEKPRETAEPEPDGGKLFRIAVLPGQDQSCAIVKYLGGQADSLQIPDEIDGLQVKEIEKSAFAHCNVREIILSESLRRIGDYAFTGCISLQSVAGGAGVREIGRGVFNGCLHLKQCEFLKNRGLHRPFDAFIDKVASQINAAAGTDKGES